MTVQEINIRNALKIANTWLSEVQYGASCFGCGEMEAIKDALEKQIPKKSIHVNTGYVRYYKCPSCGNVTLMSYCSQCGQKLDWE